MSGLSRTPGKRVGVNSPPRVRIPLSPPFSPMSDGSFSVYGHHQTHQDGCGRMVRAEQVGNELSNPEVIGNPCDHVPLYRQHKNLPCHVLS